MHPHALLISLHCVSIIDARISGACNTCNDAQRSKDKEDKDLLRLDQSGLKLYQTSSVRMSGNKGRRYKVGELGERTRDGAQQHLVVVGEKHEACIKPS